MRALALAALVAAGCTVEELDLRGRRCPCTDGWVCDEALDECVPAGRLDGGRDAGTTPDAGPRDAAGIDAAGTDAGARDAGSIDPGASDAGARDAGRDGGPPPMDAGVDAGAPDAGHDAGPPAPPSRCGTAHVGREFCDGFDTGDASGWGWTDSNAMGPIAAVTSPVYRGTHSMRFESPRGGDFAIAATQLFTAMPTPPTDVWVRAYYYFPSSHPPNIEHLQVGDVGWTQTAVSSVWGASLVNWHAHGYLGGAYHDVTYAVPLDRWICVEMHVSTDATVGGVELFWDGALLHGDLMLNGQPRPMTRIDTIFVGVVYKETTDPAQVVFVDEVVADVARVGCDP